MSEETIHDSTSISSALPPQETAVTDTAASMLASSSETDPLPPIPPLPSTETDYFSPMDDKAELPVLSQSQNSHDPSSISGEGAATMEVTLENNNIESINNDIGSDTDLLLFEDVMNQVENEFDGGKFDSISADGTSNAADTNETNLKPESIDEDNQDLVHSENPAGGALFLQPGTISNGEGNNAATGISSSSTSPLPSQPHNSTMIGANPHIIGVDGAVSNMPVIPQVTPNQPENNIETMADIKSNHEGETNCMTKPIDVVTNTAMPTVAETYNVASSMPPLQQNEMNNYDSTPSGGVPLRPETLPADRGSALAAEPSEDVNQTFSSSYPNDMNSTQSPKILGYMSSEQYSQDYEPLPAMPQQAQYPQPAQTSQYSHVRESYQDTKMPAIGLGNGSSQQENVPTLPPMEFTPPGKAPSQMKADVPVIAMGQGKTPSQKQVLPVNMTPIQWRQQWQQHMSQQKPPPHYPHSVAPPNYPDYPQPGYYAPRGNNPNATSGYNMAPYQTPKMNSHDTRGLSASSLPQGSSQYGAYPPNMNTHSSFSQQNGGTVSQSSHMPNQAPRTPAASHAPESANGSGSFAGSASNQPTQPLDLLSSVSSTVSSGPRTHTQPLDMLSSASLNHTPHPAARYPRRYSQPPNNYYQSPPLQTPPSGRNAKSDPKSHKSYLGGLLGAAHVVDTLQLDRTVKDKSVDINMLLNHPNKRNLPKGGKHYVPMQKKVKASKAPPHLVKVPAPPKSKFPNQETQTQAQQSSLLARQALRYPRIKKKLYLSLALVRVNPRKPFPCPKPGAILGSKFHWAAFPPLDTVLRDSMKEYYELSTNKCQSRDQQAFNNKLVKTIREEATKYGWRFDDNLFDDKKIRDRIRCFYKVRDVQELFNNMFVNYSVFMVTCFGLTVISSFPMLNVRHIFKMLRKD